MGSDDSSLDAILDDYLDLALRGEPPAFEAFLAEHEGLDESTRQRLRNRARVFLDRPSEDLPFEKLGEFRLLRRLGRGGMGVVFQAEQTSLGRTVALKVLRPELAGSSEVRARFAREAQTLAALCHPGIVTVHAVGADRGIEYIAMEYVAGKSVDALLREESARGQRCAPAQVVRWALDVARALECAHASGVIHRDVKPSNVLIDQRGRARLLDFGLARLAGAATLTDSDSFHGTPAFASPEQVEPRGRDVDERTDVYSLGATLYQCATGKPPFHGEGRAAVFHAILAREPVPPRRLEPRLSRDLETVILKSMEKEPERRYASAREFAEDLEALLAMQPVRARRPGPFGRAWKWARREPALAAVGLVLVLTLLGTAIALPLNAAASKRTAALRAFSSAQELAARSKECRASLATLRAEIAAREAEVPPGAPPEDPGKQALFAARSRLEQALREREELIVRADREFSTAATLAPLAETDAGLAAFLSRLYLEAEEDGDTLSCARLALRLQGTDAEAVLHPRGSLTLDTVPTGARVTAFRHVRGLDGRLEEDREHAVELGVTPLHAVALDAGSWMCRIAASGMRETRYPVLIERDREWRANDDRPIPLFSEAEIGSPRLAYVPAGWTILGPDRVNPRFSPRRVVWMEGFLLGRFEVTSGEYVGCLIDPASAEVEDPVAGVAGHASSRAPRDLEGELLWSAREDGGWNLPTHEGLDREQTGSLPVPSISWRDARWYAAWLARKTGRGFRLPTEWEWERAARGSDGREFPWGDSFDPGFTASLFGVMARLGKDARAWVPPVGTFELDVSPFGVQDLAGSLAEWTNPAPWDPRDGPGSGPMLRGGSAGHTAEYIFRATSRQGIDPTYVNEAIGFRIACDLPRKE